MEQWRYQILPGYLVHLPPVQRPQLGNPHKFPLPRWLRAGVPIPNHQAIRIREDYPSSREEWHYQSPKSAPDSWDRLEFPQVPPMISDCVDLMLTTYAKRIMRYLVGKFEESVKDNWQVFKTIKIWVLILFETILALVYLFMWRPRVATYNREVIFENEWDSP